MWDLGIYILKVIVFDLFLTFCAILTCFAIHLGIFLYFKHLSILDTLLFKDLE